MTAVEVGEGSREGDREAASVAVVTSLLAVWPWDGRCSVANQRARRLDNSVLVGFQTSSEAEITVVADPERAQFLGGVADPTHP